MSSLSEYIEQIQRYIDENPNISEKNLIRYVYLDLGQRFSFNLKFSFGNTKTKKSIYAKSESEDDLNEVMKSNIAICKSMAYIVEYILKKFDVNIKTVVAPNDERKCPHMYNIVTPKEGEEYIIDLQEDVENIQSHSFTANYGLSVFPDNPPVIKRFEIEQIDRELGFIDDKNYYSDDYLYLLKSYIGNFSNFAEKVEFLMENIDIYENKKIQYAERKWHHQKVLRELFSKDELKKIHMIDCYFENGEEKEYKNCIAVDVSRGTDIYMYSVKENRYCKMAIKEFARETKKGLVHLQGVPGLKQALRELKQESEER